MNNEVIKDVNPNAAEIQSLEAQIANINIANLDPMDNGKVLNSPVVETKQPSVQPVIETPVQTQATEVTQAEDPIKAELERVKGQTQGKTPAEKMAYKLKLEAQRAKAMGVDINEVLGIKPEETSDEIDEEKPLTRKDVEALLKNNQPQGKSAIEKAYEIQNEAERELHLYYLENAVNPNLGEEEKFNLAQTMVNSVKLKTQVTLGNIAPQTRSYSTASSVQVAKNVVDNTKLTPEEDYFFRDAKIRGVPFTKEEIIAMRKK